MLVKNEWEFIKNVIELITYTAAEKSFATNMKVSFDYNLSPNINIKIPKNIRQTIKLTIPEITDSSEDRILNSITNILVDQIGLTYKDFTLFNERDLQTEAVIINIGLFEHIFRLNTFCNKTMKLLQLRAKSLLEVKKIVSYWREKNFFDNKAASEYYDLSTPGFKKLSKFQQHEFERTIKSIFKKHNLLCVFRKRPSYTFGMLDERCEIEIKPFNI